MAEVFLAESASGEARVLKVPLPQMRSDPEWLQAFRHEAKLNRLSSHPNLVRMLDAHLEGPVPYTVMEYIDGYTLDQVLHAAALPVELSIYVMDCVLAALEHLHQLQDEHGRCLGIVHRDVSPQNILLARDGRVLLGDLGIALSALGDRLTRTGVLKGKLPYMAPEQVTCSSVDGRTDDYAAALVLWECFAGQRYLQGEGDLGLLRAAEEPVYRRARVRGSMVDDYDGLLRKALARFPEQRFPTTTSFRQELAEAARTGHHVPRGAELARHLRGLSFDSPTTDQALASTAAGAHAADPPAKTRETRRPRGERRDARPAANDAPPAGRGVVISLLLLTIAGGFVYAGARYAREPDAADAAAEHSAAEHSAAPSAQGQGLASTSRITPAASEERLDLPSLSPRSTAPALAPAPRSVPGTQSSNRSQTSDPPRVSASRRLVRTGGAMANSVRPAPPSPSGPEQSTVPAGTSAEDEASAEASRRALAVSAASGVDDEGAHGADPRLDAVRQRFEGWQRDIRQRGVQTSELSTSQRSTLRALRTALERSQSEEVARLLALLEARTANLPDRAYVLRRMTEANRRIRLQRVHGPLPASTETESRRALAALLESHYAESNRHVSRLMRSLERESANSAQ